MHETFYFCSAEGRLLGFGLALTVLMLQTFGSGGICFRAVPRRMRQPLYG
jgi:hypothetical protein